MFRAPRQIDVATAIMKNKAGLWALDADGWRKIAISKLFGKISSKKHRKESLESIFKSISRSTSGVLINTVWKKPLDVSRYEYSYHMKLFLL